MGCASPTLPLPPPSPDPTQTAGIDADHVVLTAVCGSVDPDVYVDIINLGHAGGSPIPAGQTGVIVTATSCGAYQATVFAHQYDKLEITYQENLQVSLPQMVTVGMP